MRLPIAILFAACLTIILPSSIAQPSMAASLSPTMQLNQTLKATSAVLMDETTGQILYAKNPLTRLYPASITKIMTAMIALEKGHLQDRIRTSNLAASQIPSKVYLIPGETHTLQQMLYGLMLISGNDAAVAIAQHYGRTVAGFAAMMNQKAKELGALHTHFVNPNGLQNPNHYSCAYDMALIGRAAMQNPILRKIVDTKYYAWHGTKWRSELVNLNDLLWTYPGANGIKTGWTDQAMQTIVVTAKRGNLSLLGVIMHVNGLDEVHQEATALLNYGFDHFHTGILLQKGTVITSLNLLGENIPITINHDVMGAVPNGATLPLTHSPFFVKKSNVTFYNTTHDPGENIPRFFAAIRQQSPLPKSVSLSLLPIVSQENSGSLVGTANLAIDYSTIPFQVFVTKKTPTWSAPTVVLPTINLSLLALTCACVCSTSALLVARNVKLRKKKTLYRQSSHRLGMSRR